MHDHDGGGGRAGRPDRPGPVAPEDLRVGDAERNQMAETLSQHFSAGRLDEVELQERLGHAMSAKTRADLAGLTTDLPSLDPAPPVAPAAPPRRRRGPWVALTVVALMILASMPWGHGPGFWFWFPRGPWLLVGVAALVLWRRSRHRRYRWHSQLRP